MDVQETPRRQLSQSQKKVITLLSKQGPLTKRQLSSLAGIGWATVVNSVDELIEAGIVRNVGLAENPPGKRGKHAENYDLAAEYPLALGIDVEYRTTHLALVSLKGSVVAETRVPTIQQPTHDDVVRFLSGTVREFADGLGIRMSGIAGIGIGIPGIGFPSRSPRNNLEKGRDLEATLTEVFNTRVRVHHNTKAYTLFEQWANAETRLTDFVWVAIRTGVGTGIIHQGQLYAGSHGLAGEIGHLKVVPNGPPCRCGGTGCLETVVNERYLFQQYTTHVLRSSSWPAGGEPQQLHEGLQDLFNRSAEGEPQARQVIDTAVGYLGHALAATVTVLDINTIVLSGHFGPNGDQIVEPLRHAILSEALPEVPLRVIYSPFDAQGYVQGAALLVLSDYFVDAL